jgi:hypothetical protein
VYRHDVCRPSNGFDHRVDERPPGASSQMVIDWWADIEITDG